MSNQWVEISSQPSDSTGCEVRHSTFLIVSWHANFKCSLPKKFRLNCCSYPFSFIVLFPNCFQFSSPLILDFSSILSHKSCLKVNKLLLFKQLEFNWYFGLFIRQRGRIEFSSKIRKAQDFELRGVKNCPILCVRLKTMAVFRPVKRGWPPKGLWKLHHCSTRNFMRIRVPWFFKSSQNASYQKKSVLRKSSGFCIVKN